MCFVQVRIESRISNLGSPWRRLKAAAAGLMLLGLLLPTGSSEATELCPEALRWPNGYVAQGRSLEAFEGLRLHEGQLEVYGTRDVLKFSIEKESFQRFNPQAAPADLSQQFALGPWSFRILRESFGPGVVLVEKRTHLCAVTYKPAPEDQEIWADLEVFHIKRDQEFCEAKAGSVTTLHPATQRLLNFGAQLEGPASFQARRDLEFLLRLLAQPEARRLHRQRPEIFEAVLQGVLHHANFLFAEISRRHPWLSEGMGFGYVMNFQPRRYCRNLANEAMALQSAINFVEAWGSSIADRRDLKLKDFHFLFPAFGVLRHVREDTLDYLSSKMFQPLTNSAEVHPTTKMYWRSVLFQLIEKLVKSWFEDTAWWWERTDLVAIKQGESLRFDLVGNFPFTKKSQPNDFGLFIEPSWSLRIPAQTTDGQVLVDRVTRWKQLRTPVTAHTRVVVEDRVRHQARERHNHQAAYADGGFDIVVATMSYGANADAKLAEEQKAFYSDLGFKAWKKSRDRQAPSSFQNGIESGEWDVLLKQAHAGGDLVNLMWIAQEGDWWRGERRRADGRLDRVHLFVPDESQAGGKIWISLETFRNWVRRREAASGRELVWINLSCNSGAKAVREIQAVNSGIFVPIASVRRVEPLDRSRKLGLQQVPLMRGLLEGKSFAEIQDEVELTNQTAGVGLNFAFPNDAILLKNLNLFGGRAVRVDQSVTTPRTKGGQVELGY